MAGKYLEFLADVSQYFLVSHEINETAFWFDMLLVYSYILQCDGFFIFQSSI